MDGLMTEATDLVLSNNKNFAKDWSELFKWERRKSSQDLTDVNSITLLRMSIAKSLKDRSQSEIIDPVTPKRRKSRRRRGSYSGKPKVDVQLLNSKTKPSDNNERYEDRSTEEPNKSDIPENDLTILFSEDNSSEEIVKQQYETNKSETNEGVINNCNKSINAKEESAQENSVDIGLKLAQRNFSENIFENCSTYTLTCHEIPLKRSNSSSSKQNFASETSSDKTTKSDSDTLYRVEDKKRESVDNDNASDEQISLKDLFFVNVNNSDDNISQNSLFSNSTDDSPQSRKSSIFSISKESKFSVTNEIKLDNELKCERKLSKKERKKQKRSKSNVSPTYDCPKCGVSYILSDNAARSTARCLHCDFWKSVEPVFLKREKQPWNTCRIC